MAAELLSSARAGAHTGRRAFLRAAALAGASAWAGALSGADAPRGRMGIVTYSLNAKREARRKSGLGHSLSDPVSFLEECRLLGAGGIQFPFGILDDAVSRTVRDAAQRHGMHVEAIVLLPKDERALEGFERELATARAAGATIARTTMLPGRRYEQFKTRGDFVAACERGLEALQRAEPAARKAGVRLAVENHKDHCIAEKIDVLRRLGSECVGACVDFGNNIALMEDPLETARALAPWALTVHIKDHAVRECPEGFWMSDVALGEGVLDLPALVAIIRTARPEARFNLELITRDPILVPALAPGYRATFTDLREEDFARTMAMVRAKGSPEPLARVSKLPEPDQVALENENIQRSMRYARERLGI